MLDVLGWFIFGVPWWASAIVLLIAVAAVGWLLHLPTRHILEIAALAFVAVFSQSLAQAGYKAKEKRDFNEANKAIDRATDARRKQQDLNNDPKNLRNNDGHRRD